MVKYGWDSSVPRAHDMWSAGRDARVGLGLMGPGQDNGQDEVIFDFGVHGIWVRMNDATWIKLHDLPPEAMIAADMDGNGLEDIIVDRGADGLWVQMNNAVWVQLHSLSPEAMIAGNLDANGLEDVIVDFGVHGIWVRMNNAAWVRLENLTS